MEGCVIGAWNSIGEAARSLGLKDKNIRFALSKPYRASSGYLWRYQTDENVRDGKLSNIEDILTTRSHTERLSSRISQKDLTGCLVKIWESAEQVHRSLSICANMITKILRGERTSNIYKNFIWEKAS